MMIDIILMIKNENKYYMCTRSKCQGQIRRIHC